MPSIINY